MSEGQRPAWAVVLAGGDGLRLRSLTLNGRGVPVPKQFCSIASGRTLLEDALERGLAVAAPARIVTVVAEQHRRWWRPLLASGRPQTVLEQPMNRGTGVGVLLALSAILGREQDATLCFLPADHFLSREEPLRRALSSAVAWIEAHPDRTLLLGMTPSRADPELGYVLPGSTLDGGVCTVQRFVEKPVESLAGRLIHDGALWNSFVFVVRARTLLHRFLARFPGVVARMRSLWMTGEAARGPALTALYRRLPVIDFSRDVLEDRENSLAVLAVPPCGWTDLGTPQRLGRCLADLRLHPRPCSAPPARRVASVNLADAYTRWSVAV